MVTLLVLVAIIFGIGKNMKKINAILYKVDGSREPLELNSKNRLETLQKLVGGNIEIIHIVDFFKSLRDENSSGNDLIINEEGRLFDLPINPWSQFVAHNSIWEATQFRGDIILVDGRLP